MGDKIVIHTGKSSGFTNLKLHEGGVACVIHTGKSSGFTNTHQNSKAVSNRLSRAIGHLESIRRMVEDGRDCTEVLVQLSAVKSAVNNAGKVILQDHIEHCIADAVRNGDMQVLEELNKAIEGFMK